MRCSVSWLTTAGGLLVFLVVGAVELLAEQSRPLWHADGSRRESRPVGLDGERITWSDANGTFRLGWNELVVWGWRPDAERGTQVVLRDGSVLVGEIEGISAERINVQTRRFGQIRLPRELVAGIVFRPPVEVVDRDRLRQQILATPRSSDRVLLGNQDELEGVVGSAERGNLLTGLRIEPSGTVTAIEHVVAIACRWPGPPAAVARKSRLWIGWLDGTRLAASRIETIAADVTLKLSAEVSVTAAASEVWSDACWIQPLPPPDEAGTVFLSDLPSAGYKYLPFLAGEWQLGVDHNVLGGNLRSAGRAYLKGLGMHSASRAAYELRRQFRWLDAELAVDDAGGGRGAVVFRVYLDRAPAGATSQWELAYESPQVRGRQAPLPMRVDVSGAERLALVVDYGERGDECDYANWLLARLTR